MGAYHSGVQVSQREYTFSDSGVFYHTPLDPGGEATFKESVLMGSIRSMSELNAAIAELRIQFETGSYNLVSRNCNHFADALCKKLFNKSIPSWINRAARLGNVILPSSTNPPQQKKIEKKSTASSKERPKMTSEKEKLLAKIKK